MIITKMFINIASKQIFMVEEDMSKMAFMCPGLVGLFECTVMIFGLKNGQSHISESNELDIS